MGSWESRSAPRQRHRKGKVRIPGVGRWMDDDAGRTSSPVRPPRDPGGHLTPATVTTGFPFPEPSDNSGRTSRNPPDAERPVHLPDVHLGQFTRTVRTDRHDVVATHTGQLDPGLSTTHDDLLIEMLVWSIPDGSVACPGERSDSAASPKVMSA